MKTISKKEITKVSGGTSEWVACINTNTPKDQEQNLRAIVEGRSGDPHAIFSRINCPSWVRDWNDVCQAYGSQWKCEEVRDWQDNSQSPSSNGLDGSRAALCVWR